MKRLSLSLFLILFTKLSGFCQNVIFFTPEKPGVTTSIGIAGAFKQDMRSAPIRFDQKVCIDMKELCFDAGYAFQDSRFDITNKISYMPLLLNRFRLGVGVTHHFYRYYDVFSENDFLFASRFKWCSTDFFNMALAFGLQLKIACIDSIKNQKSFIVNTCYLLDYKASWNFTEKFTLFAGLSTIDYYDYPLFGTAFFKGGVFYRPRKEIAFDVALTFKFIDIIISAVSLNECILDVGGKVYF